MFERLSLVNVWWDTQKLCSDVRVDDDKKTVKYSGFIDEMKFEHRYNETFIDVHNKDTLVMAEELDCQGFDPIVLNMACEFNPGGGVWKGCSAQEEELFRRTTYYKFLPQSLYPLDELDILYTPQVTVIKDENYEKLNTRDRLILPMIACAALKSPKLTNNNTEDINCNYTDNNDFELMRNKIDLIFQTAYYHEHDCILLGAFGCGSYANPSYRVAEIFKEMIKKYNKCFRRIAFAVLSDGKDENFNIFEKVLL